MKGRFEKRQMVAAILAVLILLPFFVSCATAAPHRATFTDVFDTVTELVAYGVSEETFQIASEAVHERLLELHRLCDRFHLYEGVTGLCAVNRRQGGDRYELESDLIALLSAGKEFYRLTGGKFNIGMGSVLALWHETIETGKGIPDPAALAEAQRHMDLDSVIIEENTVTLTDPDLVLDLGAIAKGYAAEEAAKAAEGAGLTNFSLNLGGNVLLRGQKPGGDWTIGVQDPSGGIFTVLHPGNLSAVTSGDYQRYRVLDGVRYHHIIDPATAKPARLYRAVTVLCTDSFTADALSTSLFCLPVEEGESLAARFGAEALWILPDGTARRTKGFDRYEKNA